MNFRDSHYGHLVPNVQHSMAQRQYTDVTLHPAKDTTRNGFDGRGKTCTVELPQSMETRLGYVLQAIPNTVQRTKSKFV